MLLKICLGTAFVIMSCETAQTEEIPHQIISQPAPEAVHPTIRHHDYFPSSLHEDWVKAKLEGIMRHPVNEDTRVFFNTEKERNSEDSFSLQDTRDGFLVNGQPLPSPSSRMRQLPVQYERGIAYATSEFIALLQSTAKTMQNKYPGTIMYLGNLGLREGGDIPYSVSHNSGRDGDIAFYLNDENGKFAHPKNLHKINRHFVSREPGPKYTFDVEKNATLIETLISQNKVPVQFIFVARHLRNAVRKKLAEREAPEELLTRFDAIVMPLDSHSDHFHIRIYCSNEDICAGCIDKSVIHPWIEDPELKRAACVEKHLKTLSSKKSTDEEIAAAMQRIAMIGFAERAQSKIIKNLSNDAPEVRSAAAFAATYLGNSAAEALAHRLTVESLHPVKIALLDALAKHDSESTARAMIDALAGINGDDSETASALLDRITRHIVHNPRQIYASPLLDSLSAAASNAQFDALKHAFQVVTNHTFQAQSNQETIALASQWLAENAEKTRAQWLIDGFKKASFPVTGLQMADVPILLDAIDAQHHAVSMNAQLVLKSLSHLPQDSLDWSVADARWHYTRYFKKRAKKYKIDLSDRNEKGIKIDKDK